MNRGLRSRVLWLAVAIVCAGSMSYYVVAIWSANQPEHFSDLYAPWWGAHELLLHGRNPYSPAVAREIQSVIYGAPVVPSADDPDGIAGGFAYPPLAALLLWPLVYLPFATAQIAFVGAALALMLLSLALWLRVIRLEATEISWLALALFVLGSFPVLQAIRLENLSAIAAGLIAVAVFFVATDRQIPAGLFLAASTFKPQFTLALVLGMAVWISGDWRRRRSLGASFLIAMLAVAAASEWLLPGWGGDFLRVVRAYRHYTYGHSLFDVWLSPSFGWIASAGLLVAALGLCWQVRCEPAGSASFAMVVSLLLAANVVVMPTLAPHAQLLLLPGFLCLIANRRVYLENGSLGRLLFAGAWILLAWQWIASFGLLVARARYPLNRLIPFWQGPLYTSAVLPLAILAALGWLFWAHIENLGPHQGTRRGLGQ